MPLNISVIGTNCLGAAHAAGMAEFGHRVIGVDIDARRVEVLNSGRSTIFERDLEPMLARHTATGRLRFTTDYREIADWADAHFLAVGTPAQPDGSADLAQVFSVAETLGPLLTKPTVIAGKSTVPVGMAMKLEARLRELTPAGDGVQVMWNPEFLREGYAVTDTLRPDRIVLGMHSPEALRIMRYVYALPISESVPIIECDIATAELIKTAANAYLAMKISFINAMAQMCEAAGGDVVLLADALGYDSRIGREFLNAGLGFGGGCLPKDIAALGHRAGELGVPQLAELISAVEHINATQRDEMTRLTISVLGGDATGKGSLRSGRRSSPVRTTRGTHRHSPWRPPSRRPGLRSACTTRRRTSSSRASPSILEPLADADIVLHLTEWPEFRQLDPTSLDGTVRNKVLIDGRLKLHRPTWQRAGWKVIQLGRASTW